MFVGYDVAAFIVAGRCCQCALRVVGKYQTDFSLYHFIEKFIFLIDELFGKPVKAHGYRKVYPGSGRDQVGAEGEAVVAADD